MRALRERLGRTPSSYELGWQKAINALEAVGGSSKLMKRFVNDLHHGGDGSAMIDEMKSFSIPAFHALTVRYGLEEVPSARGLLSTRWKSRGVRVEAVETGNVNIYFTGGADTKGWVNLKDALVYSQDPKRDDMPFEEKVALASKLAAPRPDYRYGYGGGEKADSGRLGMAA